MLATAFGVATLAAAGLAIKIGKDAVESAIANQTDYNFESTLGGETMTKLLCEAAKKEATLNIWFGGLAIVELHLKRVASRVKKGGHPIPESDIRKRWIGSHLNLIKLLPYVTHLRVYDNSAENDPDKGEVPELKLVLSVSNGAIDFPGREEVKDTPAWAKPIVVAALRLLSAA